MIGTKQVMKADKKSRRANRMPTGLPRKTKKKLPQAIARLDEIKPETTVVLEISHTQLQYTDRSPEVAAVTNVTPNHLDQFSWDEYVGLKRNLLNYQRETDVAVLNADDHTSRALMAGVRGKLAQASMKKRPSVHRSLPSDLRS